MIHAVRLGARRRARGCSSTIPGPQPPAMRSGRLKTASGAGCTEMAAADRPVRVGFVLHAMQVAGAEVLVAETIRRLGSRISPVIFCLDAVGSLGGRLIAEGIPVIAFGRKPGLDLRVSVRLAREIRNRRIEVIHAHQYTPFFYGAIAARLSGIRPQVIFTEHGRHYPDEVSPRRRAINRLVMSRLADRVNAVCDFSARSLAEKDGF